MQTKLSPFRVHFIYAFGPIGKYGPILKDHGFIRCTSDAEPKLDGKRAGWFIPSPMKCALDFRKRFPEFPGKFAQITDAQRTGKGPGNPAKFTKMQANNAC